MTEQLSNLLKDQDALAQIVKEWEVFTAAHKENPDLLRFRWYRPQKWLERLRNLQREPVIFRAEEGFDPKRERFITKDELDRLLRGSGNSVPITALVCIPFSVPTKIQKNVKNIFVKSLQRAAALTTAMPIPTTMEKDTPSAVGIL